MTNLTFQGGGTTLRKNVKDAKNSIFLHLELKLLTMMKIAKKYLIRNLAGNPKIILKFSQHFFWGSYGVIMTSFFAIFALVFNKTNVITKLIGN